MALLGPEWRDIPCQNCGWNSGGALWPSEGAAACDWIEQNVRLGEGDWYGQPMELRPDQVEFLYEWYSYCPHCMWWRFTKFLRGEARGGGKTQFAAALAAIEMSGPEQIAPLSPDVVVAAASFDQADEVFGQLGLMYGGDEGQLDTSLNGECHVLKNEITFIDGRPGTAQRVAAKAGTNEGGKPTLFLADETHEWGPTGEPKARLFTVLATGATKRLLKCRLADGRLVTRGPGRSGQITTAGFDVNNAMLGDHYKRGKEAQKNPLLAPRTLFDWREAPAGTDWTDPVQREVAIRAASGAADILWDVKYRVSLWGDPEYPAHEYIRYFGNCWVDVAEDSWLVDFPGAWPACADERAVELAEQDRGLQGVVAVDMALRHDSVGVCTLRWIPPQDGAPGRVAVSPRRFVADSSGRIDHVAVWQYIKAQADGLGENLRGIVYDPRFFELPARLLEDEGYELVQFDQNPARMAPACGKAFEMIKAGEFVHPDDYPLNSAVLTAARREQDNGTFTLSKGRSKNKIDLCIAMVMGTWVLQQLVTAPPARPFNIW